MSASDSVSSTPLVASSSQGNLPSDSDVVDLNVGGEIFTTTVGTLRKYPSTYFSGLFSGKYHLPKKGEGQQVFVDRDGTHFRLLLNFLRSGRILRPDDPQIRRELLIEAEYYLLKDYILAAWKDEMNEDVEEKAGHCVWESNVIFVGYRNIDWDAHKKELGDLQPKLQAVQCPDTTEHVWKSIHDGGLTVIFQICHPSTNQNTDFSLKNLGDLLEQVRAWDRANLRFVLVYDAELIRELLKLSGEKFNNSSYIWYFSRGKLIECILQWKLKYVAENIWKHYYLSIENVD